MAEDPGHYIQPAGQQTRADPTGEMDQPGLQQRDEYAPSPAEFSFDQPEFRSLDRRVIALWRVVGSIGCTLPLLATLTGAIIAASENPDFALLFYLGWFGLLALCGWLIYWRPPRLYRAWGYRIDSRVFETRSGLLFQVTRLLPLTRLQHVDLHRGPIERAFGLASLVLHTAGTHDASIRVPGLDASEAEQLRDHLVAIGGDDAV